MISKNELDKRIKKSLKKSIKYFLEHEVIDWPSYKPNKTKVINEGLIMTYSLGKTLQIISRNFDLDKLGCSLGKMPSNIKTSMNDWKQSQSSSLKTTRDMNGDWAINLFFPHGFQFCSYDILLDIVKLFKTCGWYFSNFQDNNILIKKNLTQELYQEYQDKQCMIIFRAKYGIIKDNSILGGVLYHICPTRSVDKIMQQGLIPKNHGRTTNHPSRVYLYTNRTIPNIWQNIAQNFYESSGIREFTLLEINIKELKEYMTFHFDDVRMTDVDAVYINEPISPKYITPIDNCVVDVDIDDKRPQEFMQSVNN